MSGRHAVTRTGSRSVRTRSRAVLPVAHRVDDVELLGPRLLAEQVDLVAGPRQRRASRAL